MHKKCQQDTDILGQELTLTLSQMPASPVRGIPNFLTTKHMEESTAFISDVKDGHDSSMKSGI